MLMPAHKYIIETDAGIASLCMLLCVCLCVCVHVLHQFILCVQHYHRQYIICEANVQRINCRKRLAGFNIMKWDHSADVTAFTRACCEDCVWCCNERLHKRFGQILMGARLMLLSSNYNRMYYRVRIDHNLFIYAEILNINGSNIVQPQKRRAVPCLSGSHLIDKTSRVPHPNSMRCKYGTVFNHY